MAEEEVFFVGLNNPEEIRRDILESTKDIIAVLRTYENFKKVRAEKAQNVSHLKVIVKELDVLIVRLKHELPKTRLREKETSAKPAAQSVSKQVRQEKKMTEMEKLEMELAEIEHKLSSI